MAHARMTLLLAVLLAAAGCSGDQENELAVTASDVTPETEAAPVADPKVVNVLLPVFDYEPTAGPNELREIVDLVIDATITNVAEGRRLGASGERPSHHVVLTLMPTTVYKAPPGAGAGPFYLELRRPNIPTATFRDGIPNGTRLLFFGSTKADVDEPVRNDFAGRESGQPLYGVVPEGFYIGVRNPKDPASPKAYWSSGWGKINSFDEITAALG